jgi:carbonic anhydrase
VNTKSLRAVVAGVVGLVVLGVVVSLIRGGAEGDGPEPETPDEALAVLRAGNARYVASHRTRSTDTAHDADDRRRLATGQHPFAAVLCCADSRVCPEFIFDQRPGAMFDIRNAGNLVDEDVLASVEYAVEHFRVRVVLVLGHKRCGAIAAVHEAGDKPLPHHLHAIQDRMTCIREQLQATRDQHSQAVLDQLAADNARGQAATLLKECAPLREAVGRGEVMVLSGLYDLETGRVEFSTLR